MRGWTARTKATQLRVLMVTKFHKEL